MDLSEQHFRDLVAGKRERRGDCLLWPLVCGAALIYGNILRLRALLYRFGLLPSRRLPVPVISVGNVTLGGTGKTPMVAWLARYLIGRGKRVAVLSRGYGGSSKGAVRIVSDGARILLTALEAGDEPYLLANSVPGLMVVIGADRHEAGLLAMKELKPDLFILDDGFQHLRLKRDLNILLLDAGEPFSNGRTLPAGFLRERPCACLRSDLVIYTRCGATLTPPPFPGKPTLWSRHALLGMTPIEGGERRGFDGLESARITAFSGIADPNAFFDMLEACGLRLTATLSFPDHTAYGEEELAALCRLKDASRSTLLVTTEKDAVKLAPHAARLAPTCAAQLGIAFDDSSDLEALLEKLL
jgi:tetraacyldisaccharide 4'-kinase